MINDLYEATAAGDWERAATMLTDDLVVVEADGLPMSGTFHGPDGLKELYNKVFPVFDVARLEVIETLYGGDHVIKILKMHFAQPGLQPAELCEMFRVRDGKVCEIKPYYFDPAPIIAAAEAKQEN